MTSFIPPTFRYNVSIVALVVSLLSLSFNAQAQPLEYAVSVVSTSSVFWQDRATGQPDDAGSILLSGAEIVLQTQSAIDAGSTLSVWVKPLFYLGSGEVEASVDGVSFTSIMTLDAALQQADVSGNYEVASAVLASGNINYIRITSDGGYLYLDAIAYTTTLITDQDGDGIDDIDDCAPLDASAGGDLDGDGVCDLFDLDTDNDGITDAIEDRCETRPAASMESVYQSNSISGQGAAAAIGSDNRRATLNRTTDALILDFGEIVPAGTAVEIEARARRSSHQMMVEESTNGVAFASPTYFDFDQLNQDVVFMANLTNDTRYLRLRMSIDAGAGSVQIDDVRHLGFTACSPQDIDGDGLIASRDKDTDGDGCSDVYEAGFTDIDSDMQLDGTGVDAQGRVTGAADGYTGTRTAVTVSLPGLCTDTDIAYQNVNATRDSDDARPGDGICADASGDCTLRAAIQEANATRGMSVISFEIAGELELTRALPVITSSVQIHGHSAPGYAVGAPAVSIRTRGFDALYFAEASDVLVQGLDISGNDPTGHEAYGIVLALCEDVVIKDNVIQDRARAVYANNSCGVEVIDNDLRDSGAESWDGAIYMLNVCVGRAATEMYIAGNDFSSIDHESGAGIQVVNADGLSISGGGVPGSHIVLSEALQMQYPLRLISVNDALISRVNLSAAEGAEGIGLRLLNCTDLRLQDSDIKNHATAIAIDGGHGFDMRGCNLSGAGVSEVNPVISLEGIIARSQEDLRISDMIIDESAFTLYNISNCEGISLDSDVSTGANVQLPKATLTGHTPIRIISSNDISVSNMTCKRTDRLVGTEGVMVEGDSRSVRVEGCYIEGYASGINFAESFDSQAYCNTLTWNRNGIWMFYNSDISDMAENSFRCNSIGINNYTSNTVRSYNDYWGDATGSSSYDGLGDYYQGPVEAFTWAEEAPACAQSVDPALCSLEICDNGIDDDGDGVIDCADGTCIDSPLCDDQLAVAKSTGGLSALEEPKAISAIYPNPTEGPTTIILDQMVNSLILRDMGGRVVMQVGALPAGSNQIHLGHLSSGMYLITAVFFDSAQTEQLRIE